MTRRKTQAEFVSEVKAIHGDNVEVLEPYKTIETPIKIRYKDCGHEEMKKPIKLLAGHGCRFCKDKKVSKTKTKTKEQYVNDLISHGIDYIEVLGEYKKGQYPLTVRNKKCGHIYSARADNILNRKSGCPICHGEKDTKSFMAILENKYPDEYTVLEEYVNGLTPILIKHNKCGHEWKCTPKSLMRDNVCPYCKTSKGEKYIASFLDKQNIPYEKEVTFDGCKDVINLRFDFQIIIKGRIKLIEFDGVQHFYSGKSNYRNPKVMEHDKIKNEYCKANNIPLLRIPYWWLKSDKIDTELFEFIRE